MKTMDNGPSAPSAEPPLPQEVPTSTLVRWLPAVGWIAAYRRTWLRADALAGLTMAAVLVPQAMSYATLAGLPIKAGLATALLPPLIYALLGGSYRLSVSTTSTLSLLTAEGARQVAPDDPMRAAPALALVAGAMLIVAGVLRFGFLATFISHPIFVGFKIGVALTIAVSQIGTVLSVPVSGARLLDLLSSGLSQLTQANVPTMGLAAAALLLILTLRTRAPKVPASLLAVVLSMVAVHFGHLIDRGVATVGLVPRGLPGLAMPQVTNPSHLAIPAFGLALMAFIESTAAARTVRHRDEPPIAASREMVALGAAAIAGGVSGAYAASGGLSQSQINEEVGAKTQLASVVAVGMVALTLTLFTPLLTDLPAATLGAIVLVAAIDLFDVRGLRGIAALSQRDFLLALATIGFVVALGVLGGLLAGVAVSMLVLLYEINNPVVAILGRDPVSGAWRNVADYPSGRVTPGLLVVQPRGRLYFANVQTVADRIMETIRLGEPKPTVVLLDASEIPSIDESTIVTMTAFCRELSKHGVVMWLAAVHTRPRGMLKAGIASGALKGVRIFADLDAALAAFHQAKRAGECPSASSI